MATIVEDVDVYKGRNCPFEITVKDQDGQAVDFFGNGTTNMGVVVNGVELTSDDGFIVYDSNGGVKIDIGLADGIQTFKKSYIGRLIRYSNEFPEGRPIFTERTNYRLKFNFL